MSSVAVTRRNAILERALSVAESDLPAFLDHACTGDARLRRELERLLRVHSHMGTWSLATLSHSPRAPFEPGRWLGRYELQDILGCGGMGIVYRAYDPVIGRRVAVKVLTQGNERSARQTSRFLSELRILGSIAHDNVVRVYDYGDADDLGYIVMELLEGEDLGRAIVSGRCGDLVRKLEIMRQVAAALEHIHAAGIVHRDLKPANVFLEASGRVKLMDFGIAHSDDAFGAAPGEVIGTPQYMAPEQLKGVPGGAAMDMYSFGIVLFEVLTGQRPFSGASASELLANMAAQPVSLDSLLAAGVPAGVIDLISDTTNNDPLRRPQTFSAIVATLERASRQVYDAQSISARVVRRRPWPLAAAACLSFALLSLSGVRPIAHRAPAPTPVATEPTGVVVPSATVVDARSELISAPAAAKRAATKQDTEEVSTAYRRHMEPNPQPAPEPRIADRVEVAGVSDALPSQPIATVAASAAPSAPAIAVTMEWEQVQNSDDPQALRAFAAKYPESTFGHAAARLADELDARTEAKRQILLLLERYAAAYRARNVQEIAALWPGLGPDRLRRIVTSFANAEKFEFTLDADREPQLSEPAQRTAYASAAYRGEAVVACLRRVQMIDRSGVRPAPSENRVVVRLTREDNTWRIVSIDEHN